MCGICGIITRKPLAPQQAEAVARLNTLLQHRGPDGEGVIRADHLCLAMRRLSIIDLTTGAQPLYNEDRSLALICNGEVYNFVELRKDLEARGHRFATRSDCETILHLYEDHGDDCVQHLRGMYAFALWDAKKRRVLLARDRMGEKPLYLVERGGGTAGAEIVFSSELRALVQAGIVDLELDPGAIHEYFHYGWVPEPRCPIKGVRKLPAGHLLTIDVDTWTVKQRCYWRMEDSPPIETARGDPATLIREQLERISEQIIRSDVPVGVALSGGLDSSVIAVLAQKNYPGIMQAITIGYQGTPWQDERSQARELAAHLGMPIHEVELTREDMLRSFPQMTIDRDEPIDDLSGIGYWTVMKRAREENLPVMLAGQGGDELFWGYAWLRQAAAATKRRNALRNGASGGNGSAVGLRDYLSLSRPPMSYTGSVRWLKSLGGLGSGLRQWREDCRANPDCMVFYEQEPMFREAMATASALYTPQFAEQALRTDPRDVFTTPRPWPDIEVSMIRLIAETYLRQNGIAQGDRLSMAWSVELRLPLVDYRLVETVIGLTKARPSVAGLPKQWLRDAVRDIVPPFVMQRRKRGFGTPWRDWGRALSETYGNNVLDGFLRQHGVLSERGAAYARKWLTPSRLFLPRQMANRALMLEMWGRGLADRDPQPARHQASPLDVGAGARR